MNSYILAIFVVFVFSFSPETVHCDSSLDCTFEKSINTESLHKFFGADDHNKDGLTPRNIFISFFASEYSKIRKFLAGRENFLSTILSSENVVDLFLLSLDLRFDGLKEKAGNLIQKMKTKILEDKRTLSLSFENVKKILREIRVGISKNNEELRQKIYNFVISWVKKDTRNRENYLPPLLKTFPVEDLSASFVKERVLTDSLVTKFPEIVKYFQGFVSRSSSTGSNVQVKGPQVFIMGRDNTGDGSLITRMDAEMTKTHNLPENSQIKRSYGTTVVGQKIYVGGGYQRNNQISNKLQSFDVVTNTWTDLPPMRIPRANTAMTTINGEIYVSGGFDRNDRPISSVMKYSPGTNKWTEVRGMNEKRGGHQLVTLNNEMYAIGGRFSNSVEKYNPSTNTWSYVAVPRNQHNFGSATVYQDKIYALTGTGFERYDPRSNRWQNLPRPPVGSSSQLVSVNGKLRAIGGRSNARYGSTSKATFEFDSRRNTWIELHDVNIQHDAHRALVVDF